MAELLHSEYIIDGIHQDLTPAHMLDECLARLSDSSYEVSGQIVDESLEPSLADVPYDIAQKDEYVKKIDSVKPRTMPVAYAQSYTVSRIAQALIDMIWKDGHFRLGDLALSAEWKCNPSQLGHCAAFYTSVHTLADCADSLNLRLRDYSVKQAKSDDVMVSASFIIDAEDDDEVSVEMPFRTRHPHIDNTSMMQDTFLPDESSWIIYVPFESCGYNLGGSILNKALGSDSGKALDLSDPDYFIDCYEVVRELVEDQIVIAGATVGEGGLISALRHMAGNGTGADIQLADLKKTSGENDLVRILFSEVPGVVIQIRDMDYDYVDAEFLLQDVAFFPLGHPVPGRKDLAVGAAEKTGVQAILEALIMSQSSEGED